MRAPRRNGKRSSLGSPFESAFEALEPRKLLSGFSWTAEEVLLLELVNRARSDPMAEGARYGLDLTADLTAGEIARLVPSEPLALNEPLTVASRLHALDMAERDFFDHVNPDGLDPTDRAQSEGYAGTAGENIAAGYDDVEASHIAWLDSVGHRKNVLSLFETFTDNFHYDEFGAGIANTDIAPFFDYYAQLFGYPGAGGPDAFLMGVVITDTDNDRFYDIGEGLADVLVEVFDPSDPGTPVAAYTTDAAGNYQFGLDDGTYTVRFTNLATSLVKIQTVTLGGVNQKLDALASEMTGDPESAIDDHANAGDWTNASALLLSGDATSASSFGRIDPTTDADLFTFTAPSGGQATIRVTSAEATLDARVRLFDANGVAVALGGDSEGAPLDSTIVTGLLEGSTYYVLVDAENAATTGLYTVFVQFGDGQVEGDPADAWRSMDGGTLSASTLGDGLAVSLRNGDGAPIVYLQNTQGQWETVDLLAVAGGSTPLADPVTWNDNADGLLRLAMATEAGVMVYTRAADGSWSLRNLSAEVDGSEVIARSMTTFKTINGLAYLAGLTEDGQVVAYRQTGLATAEGLRQWAFDHLSRDHLSANGLQTPEFTGELISFVTSWNALNIAGLDADGRINAVWWAPGLSAWTTNNLSELTGAPTIFGGLSSYLTSWGAINLTGLDDQGAITVTWWVPGIDWTTSNLTEMFDGPLVDSASVATFVTPWGGTNVMGLDAESGELVVYWWAPGLVDWVISPLADGIQNAPAPAGGLEGISTLERITVFGTESDGDVVQFFWDIGGVWQAENMTETVLGS